MTKPAINPTATFAMGFCSGTSNIFGDATCTHFVGVQAIGTWTENSAATFPPTANVTPATKVGTTVTLGTAFGQTVGICNGASSATADRIMWFIDLIKGSPNFTLKEFSHTSLATLDSTQADFLAQMEQATPAFSNHTYSAGQTIAVDEAGNGTLNAINFYWSNTSLMPELCDIAVARLA
jgi:hypothetical protein